MTTQAATTTTKATPTNEPTPVTKGCTLPCPRCGEAAASIHFDLADGETFYCKDCDGDFTATELRELAERWAPILAWADAMPTRT